MPYQVTSYHHIQHIIYRPATQLSAQTDEKAGGDERLAGLLSIITSITKQCADSQVDLDGLEPALWVLTHVGTRVGHIMTLVVEAANERFDRIGAANQVCSRIYHSA